MKTQTTEANSTMESNSLSPARSSVSKTLTLIGVVVANLIGLGATACAVGSEESQFDEETISIAEQPLFLEATKWPDGKVPVCWPATTRARKDFAARSNQVKDLLNASWPAVANVEFTGWGACPSNTGGMAVIHLHDAEGANSDVGYGGAKATHTVNLGVLRGDFAGSLIPHEFGHLLGFGHEMRRPDFADDASGSCRETNGTGDTLGTPPDRASIMASTGYCQQNSLLTRWDIVGSQKAYGYRADNVITAGSTLYARKLSNGDLYRRDGTSWTRIGNPGSQFVAVGSTLYGLSTDRNEMYQYAGSGTTWTRVGNSAREILRCGTFLCATDADNGDLYRRETSGWKRIGGRAAGYASTDTTLYRLTEDRSAVERYSGSGTTWTVVGGAASFVFASYNILFATSPVNGDLYRYHGSSWSRAGGPGRTFVNVGSKLYALSPARDGVYVWSGTAVDSGATWTHIGGASDWIYGGQSGSLYATNPTNKDIYRYNGTSWVHVGQP
jgi:hypothetical protein